VRWIPWPSLTIDARAAVKEAAERIVSDCETGVEEAMKALARQLVEAHRVQRQHIAHILDLAARAAVEQEPKMMRDIVVEIGNVCRSGLSQGIEFDLPTPHPAQSQALGSLFYSALTKSPPTDYIKSEEP
jgi:hypothetical protein